MVHPGARFCTPYMCKDNEPEPTTDQEPEPDKSDQVCEPVVLSIAEGVLVELDIMKQSNNHYSTPEVQNPGFPDPSLL